MIAVFTKYDQFKRNIKMVCEEEDRVTDIDAEVESVFKQHYLADLRGSPPYIRLESEGFVANKFIFC